MKKFHQTLKQKNEAYRVNTVILLGTGYTPQQVAEILLHTICMGRRNVFILVDRGTSVRYLQKSYAEQG